MIIRHQPAPTPYTMLDRYVFTDRRLSDGAKVLYGYLKGLKNGANYNDKYLLKALNTSQASLTRRKKELKDADLIMIDQVTPRLYVIYIGHTKMTASEVKARWKTEEDRYTPVAEVADSE